MDRAGIGLFQTSLDGRILWMNASAARLFGYASSDELKTEVDRITSFYVDPSRRDELRRAVQSAGRVDGFVYEMRRRDGATRWISINGAAFTNPEGDIAGIEGSFEDVTERTLLQMAGRAITSDLEPEEAIRRYAQVLARAVPFSQLSLLVVEETSYRRLVSVSPVGGVSRFLPGETLPLEGNSMGDVVRSRSPLVIQDTSAGRYPFDAVLSDRGIGSYAVFPLLESGDVFATFNVGRAEANGFDEQSVSLLAAHAGAAAGAVRNILRYEREREAVANLRTLDEMKNEFLARVAHDLRGPLTVIMGLADTVARRWTNLDDHQKVKALDSIGRNARRLAVRVQRDLDVALIQSGDLRFRSAPFDVGALVDQIAGEIEAAGVAKVQIDVEPELPAAVGDEERTRQVIENLLSNAAKYSPEDASIQMAVAREGGGVRVSVCDRGEGLAEGQAAVLFTKMGRVPNSREVGTGLGLYICRSFVEGQGGRIWAESTPGRGASFHFVLPTQSSSAGSAVLTG